jgi:hypothetical protein
MKIAIITFIVGNDYKKGMEIGIQTKIEYGKKHGYDFYFGGEDVWDRTRPIPWSKLKYIEKFLDKTLYNYDYLFVSDADVMITNDEVKLESLIEKMEGKDLMWTYDACEHLNSGNMFLRVNNDESVKWIKDFFTDVWNCEELIHHIWWENAGMIKIFQTNEVHRNHIKTCEEYWLFNNYLFDGTGKSDGSSRRLWEEGDFLVHYAGIYKSSGIQTMMKYMKKCLDEKTKVDRKMLENILKDAEL